MNAEGLKVWILMFVSIGPNGPSKAQPIPCSSLEKLKAHAATIIERNIDQYSKEGRIAILEKYKQRKFDEVIALWKMECEKYEEAEFYANTDNRAATKMSFDLYWDEDERPEVVL